MGTPQGGVISPVAWNLVFESLLRQYDEGRVKICGFADDAGLIITGHDLVLMQRMMQTAVDKALHWGRRKGLTFSPSKTVCVLFTRKRKFNMPPPIRVGGMEIPFSSEVRYLGVMLDEQLTWKPHVKKKIKAAKGSLLRLRSVAGKLWGPSPSMSKWIYTGIVRPALTYGAVVWSRVCDEPSVIRDLTRLNRLALITLGHFRRGTPTAGLEIITYTPPLPIWIKAEALSAFQRVRRLCSDLTPLTDRKSLRGFKQVCLQFQEELGINDMDTDFITPELNWVKKYVVDRDSFKEGKPPHSYIPLPIYTDGSRFNDRAGSGVVCYKYGELVYEISRHLGTQASVFQAEVLAIKEAMLWSLESEHDGEMIDIYVDSQAALQAVASFRISSRLVKETVDLLNEVGGKNLLTLHWIQAHAGHSGNEKADQLAKKGASDLSLWGSEVIDAPLSHVKSVFRGKVDELWSSIWNRRPDCRQTKQWFPTVNRLKSHQLLKLDRVKLSGMVQMITGHNFLKRHESLVHGTEDNECRLCCEEEETSYHIMIECPALARLRLNSLGTMCQVKLHEWSVNQVINFLREVPIDGLLTTLE